MKKYLAVAAVVALVAFAAPAFAATNPFMDVPLNHWSYDAIGQLAAHGVLSGYPDGTYKGKQPTTRYEMASALARALAVVELSKASKQDVEMLKKLVVEFKDELDTLGVQVDQFDGRIGKIEERLGGWKLSGSLRMDLYDIDDGIDAGSSGTAFIRTRLEIQRWFGEDEGMHLYIRLNDSQNAYGAEGKGVTFNKFYVEIPLWWDTTLTVGRFAWDVEGEYYLADSKLTGSMGWGFDAWATDRTVDGFGLKKSFGLGNFTAYVAHPSTLSWWAPASYGAWEFLAAAQLQFTEQFGFDVGVQYFLGDDTSKVSVAATDTTPAGTFELDNILTAFAGARFNFNENIGFKAIYYYQDVDYDQNGVSVNPGDTAAFKGIIEVKQDLLKFSNLWLEYSQLEAGFLTPNTSLVPGANDGWNLGGGGTGRTNLGLSPSVQAYDQNIWRIGARQQWNDKWTTFGYVANHNLENYTAAGGDVDVLHWALGVMYQYNANVQFGLAYSQFDADSAMNIVKDPRVIRFRTFVSF